MNVVALEEAFWSNVWQCRHRRPCKKCCWPWKKIELSANWKCIWETHATFYHKELPRPLAAYRVAYELTRGLLLIRGHAFPMCHQCHFGPCCNPWHVLPGSSSDNGHDRRRHTIQARSIILPDGRRWSYTVACSAQEAFYEARDYQRIFAGPIPKHFCHLEREVLDHTRGVHDWPGVPLSRQDALRTALLRLARTHDVSLSFLASIAATLSDKEERCP